MPPAIPGPSPDDHELHSLHARFSDTQNNVLVEAARTAQITVEEALNRIVQGFVDSSPEDRNDVIAKRQTLRRLGETLALVNWANHSFSLQHWTWAIKCYRRLEVLMGPHDPFSKGSSLRLFALYRQGYAWAGLGIDLRNRALKLLHDAGKATRASGNRGKQYRSHQIQNSQTHYGAAIDAVKRGIACNSKILTNHPAIAIIHYNTACCYSLSAQFTVEAALECNPRSPWLDDLCLETVGSAKDGQKAWGRIGQVWRDHLDPKKKRDARHFSQSIAVQAIDDYSSRAMDHLELLAVPPSQELAPSFVPWPYYEYIPQKAREDSDLLFLQSDSRFSADFAAWVGAAPDDWLLRNYEQMTAGDQQTAPSDTPPNP